MTDWRVIEGDCIEAMAAMPESSVDSIVTDPPYGLGFMGKHWDSGKSFVERKPVKENRFDHVGGNHNPSNAADAVRTRRVEGQRYGAWCEVWGREALRALRPGGYILAFGGTRTYHRLASGLEDAGLEVRDMVEWLYGSGFPKHESCLKPAHEPIMLGRKAAPRSEPLRIDACRIGTESTERVRTPDDFGLVNDDGWEPTPGVNGSDSGRWPANVALDPEAAALLDEQTGSVGGNRCPSGASGTNTIYSAFAPRPDDAPLAGYGDTGGASRFFYCAKAGRDERDAGLDHLALGELRTLATDRGPSGEASPNGQTARQARNVHPTVKPIDLMRWLCRLITPPGGTVLDPFTGSGTTGCAAALEGFDFIGIEREAEYAAIARARIAHWWKQPVQLGLEAA